MLLLVLILGLLLLVFVLVVGTTILPAALPLVMFGTVATIPPGAVPPTAALPPLGPLPGETTSLTAAIRPWLGTGYVFGGNTLAGVDCSGFSLAIYRQVYGASLPRTAQGQFNATDHPAEPIEGDLVFFHSTYDSRPDWVSHVGIYIGGGWMVSAIQPTLGRQSLGDAYWRAHFVGYGRLRR